MGLLGFLISWGLTDQEGRRSILMQRAGNSRSSVFFPLFFFLLSFTFFPSPLPLKCGHFTLVLFLSLGYLS